MRFSCLIVTMFGFLAGACVHSGHGHEHGKLSELTANSKDPTDLCEHRVPEDVCVLCVPELIEQFKAVNDWCPPHDVPESQCYRCHPGLSFKPLPHLPEGADLVFVSPEKALGDLSKLAVDGKITVVDFWASWCVPCRKVDGHMRTKMGEGSNVALRKIQITGWDDPIAAQHLNGTADLPFLVVFDPDGKRVGHVSGARLDELDTLLEQALGR